MLFHSSLLTLEASNAWNSPGWAVPSATPVEENAAHTMPVPAVSPFAEIDMAGSLLNPSGTIKLLCAVGVVLN